MFRGPSHIVDTPPGDLKSEGSWAPKGKERSGEVGGGRAGHHHLLSEEDLVHGRRESAK